MSKITNSFRGNFSAFQLENESEGMELSVKSVSIQEGLAMIGLLRISIPFNVQNDFHHSFAFKITSFKLRLRSHLAEISNIVCQILSPKIGQSFEHNSLVSEIVS